MKPIDGDELKRELASVRSDTLRGNLKIAWSWRVILVILCSHMIDRIERMRPLRKGGYHG